MTDSRIKAVVMGDLNLLRCFVHTGIETVVLYSDPESPMLWSRDCREKFPVSNPREDLGQAAEDLVRRGERFIERPVLYYSNDDTLLLISRYRDRLERYYRFLMPDRELIEDMVDKTRFAAMSRRLSLPVPQTVICKDAPTLEQAERMVTLPCVFKPSWRKPWFSSLAAMQEGCKHQKALHANTSEEFRRLYVGFREFTDNFVMQEYIPGDDSCIYSFHAWFDHNSKPLGWYVGRKIRSYPADGGISTCLELVREPRVAQGAIEMLQRMKFVGPVKCDFKKDQARNRFVLLEINPRFTLWNYLGMACGVNLPIIAWNDLLGKPTAEPSGYRTGVRWLCLSDDARAFVRDYHPSGKLSWLGWLWSLRGRKVYDVFSWRDPMPWVISAERYLRKLLGRVRARVAR